MPFVRTWNRAQNCGRQTGPLVEKLVPKLITAGCDLVAKNIFWSQMATRRPDFSSPAVISGESGRRPPPRRFAPRGRTSPYSPEMTGGTYIYHLHFYLGVELGVEWLCINIGLSV